LQVRGAPALGAAAGLGVYIGIKDIRALTFEDFNPKLQAVISYIASSRPTARNLFWGLERVADAAHRHQHETVARIKKWILNEALAIIEEDRSACRIMGRYGAALFNAGDGVLTICNTGILATIDYGTALGVIYTACAQGKKLNLYACETRPLLQGARLTTWELAFNNIPVTLICDSIAATLMKQGKITRVIAGADRIVVNGDTANKIGTYNLAVLCKHHGLPFYIAAPVSTFDLALKAGKDIPIEERDPGEVSELFFAQRMAAQGVKVYNPAFDVTPGELITAIICEKGIIYPPYGENIAKVIGR
jgi:methylthioribose-1-phosphate isomerase